MKSIKLFSRNGQSRPLHTVQSKRFRPLKNAAWTSVGAELFLKERSFRLCPRVLTAERAKTIQKTWGQPATGRTIRLGASTRPLHTVQSKRFRPLKNAAWTSVGAELFLKERSFRLCPQVLTAERAKTIQKTWGQPATGKNNPPGSTN